MKIIELLHNYGETASSEEGAFCLRPDSALLKNGKPFFVPDFASRTGMTCQFVFHVCRLGKAIAEKFAYRYYDQVTAGVCFTAVDKEKELSGKGLPWEASSYFDGSVVVGDMLPLAEHTQVLPPLTLRLDLDGKTVQEYDASGMRETPGKALSRFGRYSTLKIGDLLYMGSPYEPLIVEPGHTVEAYINGKQVLGFHIR